MCLLLDYRRSRFAQYGERGEIGCVIRIAADDASILDVGEGKVVACNHMRIDLAGLQHRVLLGRRRQSLAEPAEKVRRAPNGWIAREGARGNRMIFGMNAGAAKRNAATRSQALFSLRNDRLR